MPHNGAVANDRQHHQGGMEFGRNGGGGDSPTRALLGMELPSTGKYDNIFDHRNSGSETRSSGDGGKGTGGELSGRYWAEDLLSAGGERDGLRNGGSGSGGGSGRGGMQEGMGGWDDEVFRSLDGLGDPIG